MSSVCNINYDNEGIVIDSLCRCIGDINLAYILSKVECNLIRDSIFVSDIIKILSNVPILLEYISDELREDLSRIVDVNFKKQMDKLSRDENAESILLELRQNYNAFIDVTKNRPLGKLASGSEMQGAYGTENISVLNVREDSSVTEAEQSEAKIGFPKRSNIKSSVKDSNSLKTLVEDCVFQCKILLSETFANQDAIGVIQVTNIALNIKNIDISAKINLREKLVLVKDILQQPIVPEVYENFSGKPSFFLDLKGNLNLIVGNETNVSKIFIIVTNLFLSKYSILNCFTNEKLTYLYDRLKNSHFESEEILDILEKIHQESKLRYNYPKLGSSGYALLKRFQNYDNILQNLENSIFTLTEAFLFHHQHYLYKTLNILSKHLEVIRAIGIANCGELKSLLKKSSSILSDYQESTNIHQLRNILSSIQAQLGAELDELVLKKFAELDKFQIYALQKRYVIFFKNITALLHGDAQNLQGVIAHKIAQEYNATTHVQSIAQMRELVGSREEIESQLSVINFIKLFSVDNIGTLSTLNLHTKIVGVEITSGLDYIKAIFDVLVSNASAAQLDILYKPLLNNSLNPIEVILKKEIQRQIHQRTSITKMLYSALTGKRKEFKALKSIKHSLSGKKVKSLEQETA